MRVSLLFCHGTSIYSKLIRLGQRLCHLDPEYRAWNHVAILVQGSGPTPIVIEALSRGVVATPYLFWQKGAEQHLLVPINADPVDHAQMADFAIRCADRHEKYGWLTIVTIVGHLLTGGKISISLDGTEICSGLAARMLERKDEDWESPNTVMPGQLAKRMKAKYGTKLA